MSKNELLTLLEGFEEYQSLKTALNFNDGPISIFGLSTAHKAHILSGLVEHTNRSMLIILTNDSECRDMEESMASYGVNACVFPAESAPVGISAVSSSGGTGQKRIETLRLILNDKARVVITTIKAFMERIAPPHVIKNAAMSFKTGDTIDLKELVVRLINCGYERVEQCDAVATFTVRGGRIDIYPMQGLPCRIELFDDEIDSMRLFDPQTQRSIENIDEFEIPPATLTPINEDVRKTAVAALEDIGGFDDETALLKEGGFTGSFNLILPFLYDSMAHILDYFPEQPIIALDEPSRLMESANTAYELFADGIQSVLAERPQAEHLFDLYMQPNEAFFELNTRKTIMFFAFTRTFAEIKPNTVLKFDAHTPPQYMMSEKPLAEDIAMYKKGGYTVLIYAGDTAKKLQERLSELGEHIGIVDSLGRSIIPGEVLIIAQTLPLGLVYRDYKFVLITENELYGKRYKNPAHTAAKKTKAADRMLLSSLNVGDYIVHDAHGIGRFAGVVSLTVDDTTKDYILLEYAASDRLYIPTDQMDRIQKYIGGEDDVAPKLSKLGGGEWQKTLKRVRSGVKALAFDLVRLYGERMNKPGFAFSADTIWQQQLESAFPYEETPDQLTCIDEIKHDMESPSIMDRLLCGDVGFGKTEVALRMAFKATMDSKQVAFLVPTTILAHQHYNTLASRFSGFPVNVDVISRFKSPAEQKLTLKKLEEGNIDVIIGTHRLLSKDVKFRDLGLLIIDEEQRFGVGHKETIKELKKTVDVLTLTATPIPRTLHMSLIGVRDVSIIETAPSQRYPVQTYVVEYSDALIREAVLNELGRGGQVFFLYNDVSNMDRFMAYLSELVPEASVRCAHGQMNERQLENTMMDFLEGKFNLLLCSTIIENGLDVQNANTIIVYNADKFGLAQLYQLRGRVGRGARLGFAYLTFHKNKVLTEVAQKRLAAIKEFTKLGMGYKIALRDLQIRGAGNMLGPEQHGHMAEVGYELYRQFLSDAISQARGKTPAKPAVEASVEIPVDAYIPKDYIKREDWRLAMYRRIAVISDMDMFIDVQDELIDRYGDLPEPVANLLNIAYIKALASACFITKLTVSPNGAVCTFAADAPYDIHNLMLFIGSDSRIQFQNDENPVLTLSSKGATPLKLMDSMPRFLCSLKDCLTQETQ